MSAIQEGRQAHAAHKMRVENPYIQKAANWDCGWTQRQKEQLRGDNREEDATRISSFKKFWMR